MKELIKFIGTYIVIGLALAFLYVLITDRINLSGTNNNEIQPLSFAPAVSAISPSVVSIFIESAEPEVNRRRGVGPLPPHQTKVFLGSGVIVSPDGHIVTNRHVIKSAKRVLVFLSDNQPYEAAFVGQDEFTDLAVIKIEAEGLTPARFGDSDLLNTGDMVLAVGNPFGLNQTVTMGIVSGTGRQGLNISILENFIQTDAAINQGNSGGPLINTQGQVVGISTASYAQYGAEGINFAIPANSTVAIVHSILEHGRVLRGWLGMSFIPTTAYKIYGIQKPEDGIFVYDVATNSAAALAGIQKDDVITHINDIPIDSFEAYEKVLRSHLVGDQVKITGYNQNESFLKLLTVEPPPTRTP